MTFPHSKLMIATSGLCMALLLSCGWSAAASATNTDSQIWTAATFVTNVAPQVDVALELHARLTEDSSTMGQRLVRPSVTYKINDYLSLTGGYFYGLNNSSTSSSSYEQRIWEQVGYTFFRHENGMTFSGRTRLEQRFVEGQDETGWRLRQQFRFETPYLSDNRLKGVLSNETFIGMNDTAWGQRSDIDQTRTFIGVNLPVGDTVSFEPGYLNQAVFRNGENSFNHVLALNVSVRF